jgi:hypothetical protein
MRRITRHPVNYPTVAENRRLRDLCLRIVNISAQGFMAEGETNLGRGERIIITLPHLGRIEAHLLWFDDHRAGFQFERIIRMDDYCALLDAMQPNPRLRRAR